MGSNEKKTKYQGYGYHGGGRKATGIKRVSICISGQPEEIESLKRLANESGKTVSRFLLDLALKPEAFFTKFLANIISCPMCIHYDLEQFDCTHGATDCYNHTEPGTACTCPFFVLKGSKTEKGY